MPQVQQSQLEGAQQLQAAQAELQEAQAQLQRSSAASQTRLQDIEAEKQHMREQVSHKGTGVTQHAQRRAGCFLPACTCRGFPAGSQRSFASLRLKAGYLGHSSLPSMAHDCANACAAAWTPVVDSKILPGAELSLVAWRAGCAAGCGVAGGAQRAARPSEPHAAGGLAWM